MSRHRAYVAIVHSRGVHTTELSDFVSRQESPCHDIVPRHASWFGSRQTFICSVSRQKFNVATGFRAGTWCLGHDKGPLVSQQIFPKAGLFLSRQKILCCDRVCRGGDATKSFLS